MKNKNNSSGLVLVIKDKHTGQVYQIGENCELMAIEISEWKKICFIRDNPELTIKEICKELAAKYATVYGVIRRYKLPVRRERLRES